MSIPVSVLSRPEHRLLSLCACSVHSPASKRDFAALVRQDLDWNYLLPRLQTHGLLALFSHHMCGQEAVLPDRAQRLLQTEFVYGLQRRLKMLTELQQVVEFLLAQGLPVLAYKGPTLAHLAYGSIALRPFSDLDLLIAPADKAKVIELLKTQGYVPENEDLLPAHLEAKRQLRDYEMTLLPTIGLGALDLHWAVAPPYDAFPLHFETLWQGRVASNLLPSVPTFCREDLLLCLCAHGLKHRWHRLEWIGCLLAILSNETEPLQWQQVQNKAINLNSGRALRLGLRLAFDLAAVDSEVLAGLQKNVPKAIRHAIATDVVANQLARQVWKTLFEQENNQRDEAFITVPALIFAIRAREGWKLRWNYFRDICRAFLVPDSEDVAPHNPGSRVVYFVRFQRLILRRLHRLVVLRRF